MGVISDAEIVVFELAGSEFVEDGVTGFVGEPTPAGLAEALTRLWDERASAPKLGDAGYQRVQCITWDAVFDALTSAL